MRQITKDWLEAASTDIESIVYLIQDVRLTGQVAFHAQQAIEKSLKAIIEEHGERVPKIHSLSKLFDLCAEHVNIQIDEDIIIALDSLYLESRYPGDFVLLPAGKPTRKQAQLFFEFAKEVYQFIKQNLESKN